MLGTIQENTLIYIPFKHYKTFCKWVITHLKPSQFSQIAVTATNCNHQAKTKPILGWCPVFTISPSEVVLSLLQSIHTYSGWWYTYPSEWWSSSVGKLFPIYGKNKKCSKPPISRVITYLAGYGRRACRRHFNIWKDKNMFQTTNQYSLGFQPSKFRSIKVPWVPLIMPTRLVHWEKNPHGWNPPSCFSWWKWVKTQFCLAKSRFARTDQIMFAG